MSKSKFEILACIQTKYRRGLLSYEESIHEIKKLFPYAKDSYLDWLLYEYEFN